MHSESHFDKDYKADEESNTVLVVDILHSWTQIPAASAPEWESEINDIAFIATPVHNLMVLYHSQLVRLHPVIHLIYECLARHGCWHRFRRSLNFLLHKLNLDVLDTALYLMCQFFHSKVP